MYVTARKTKWLYIGNESRLSQWAGSLARLGHPLDVRKVTGSNPVRPTKTAVPEKSTHTFSLGEATLILSKFETMKTIEPQLHIF